MLQTITTLITRSYNNNLTFGRLMSRDWMRIIPKLSNLFLYIHFAKFSDAILKYQYESQMSTKSEKFHFF